MNASTATTAAAAKENSRPTLPGWAAALTGGSAAKVPEGAILLVVAWQAGPGQDSVVVMAEGEGAAAAG